jgi:glutathione S-transferase
MRRECAGQRAVRSCSIDPSHGTHRPGAGFLVRSGSRGGIEVKLVVASLNYSSWSARAWLALTHAGAEFETHRIGLFVDEDWREQVEAYSGAGLVPVLVDGDLVIHESLAICEYVNELYPDAGLWPESRADRALARAYSAEMASGFRALRMSCPMNCRALARGFEPNEETVRDVVRVAQIFELCRQRAQGGPFLFGRFGIVDCMYMPVVSRFRTYGIELEGAAADYAASMWEHPAVQAWTAVAEQAPAMPRYDAMLEAG